MKYFFVLLIISALGFAAQASGTGPTTVLAMYKNIYVPHGFDSNDNVQIAAEGVFPTSCFKIAPPSLHVDENNKIITLDAQAYRYNGVICMQILVPFQQIVDVGIIKTPGQYKIQTSAGILLGQVEVAQARTSDPDDYFYAPVQRVTFDDSTHNRVSLRIEFSSNCLAVGELRVDKQKNVVVIQPISKLTGHVNCAFGYFPTTQTVDLGDMTRGRYLLHVRSSGSQANNQIVTIE